MMLKIFETMKQDARINEKSYVRSETVLHLAAEEGLSTCVKRLIDLGADLSDEDFDGNTVLHRITRATVLNPKQLKRHLEVFDTVLNGVVKWWCIKKSVTYPEKDNRADYMKLRSKACLYLFNEVPNKKGLSVLALSFYLGASDIIARLLMLPGVTMFEVENTKNDRYVLFDITRLMPHTKNAFQGCCRRIKVAPSFEDDVKESTHAHSENALPHTKNALQGCCRRIKVAPSFEDDVKESTHAHSENALPHTKNALQGCCRREKVLEAPLFEDDVKEPTHAHSDKALHLSALELLITQNLQTRAAQILDLPPIKEIKQYYTSIVTWTFGLLMLFHISYMSIFTYVGLNLLGKLRDDPNTINLSDPVTLLQLCIIVPIEPAMILIYVVYTNVRFIRSDEMIAKQKLSRKQGCAYVAYVIKSDFHAYMHQLVGVMYAALIIAWIVLFSVEYSYQDYVLAAALCIGWLLSILFTRGFKGIHYFYRMLISMILRDVVRFIFVYLFVLLAFGFAFHVLFQISSAVVADYESPIDTLFLSFNMMIGMGELFDGVFENNMSAVGRTMTCLKLFYLLYIILSTIIILNLLIAMMNDSYSKILRDQLVTWRIDSVSLGVDIETSFPASKCFSKVSIMNGTDSKCTTVNPKVYKNH